MGVGTASGDRFPFFMKLRDAGDVIALDQRGTPSSRPYPICPGIVRYRMDRGADSATMARAHEPVLEECWRHTADSIDPSAFTTNQSVEDLEHLRIVLGADRLSLVGISYGTHLALAYIRRHPDRVARAVLAGVEGPGHTYKRPAVVDRIVRAIDRTLDEEAGWSGFGRDIETAIRRLENESPQVVVADPETGDEVAVAIGPVDLKRAVLFGIAEREDFLRAARRVRRIAEGDDDLLARFAFRLRSGGRFSVMPLSMDCASGVSTERLEMIHAEEPSALVGDVANLDLVTTCPYWPVEDLGESYRGPLASDVEVLAVSGTLDSRTPPSNAVEALAGFSRWKHLQIVGGAHGDDLLIGTRGIAAAMARFLEMGDAGVTEIVLPPLKD